MNETELRGLLLGWRGVTASIKWGDVLVFSVADKMFCACRPGESGLGGLSFKVESERFLEFTDRPGIQPAPYLARAHWIRLDDPIDMMPADELRSLLRQSCELVLGKLSKRLQRELAG